MPVKEMKSIQHEIDAEDQPLLLLKEGREPDFRSRFKEYIKSDQFLLLALTVAVRGRKKRGVC